MNKLFRAAAGKVAITPEEAVPLQGYVYGDTLLEDSDLQDLMDTFAATVASAAVLVSPLGTEESRDWICCNRAADRLEAIFGHPRGGFADRFAAFAFSDVIWPYLQTNAGIFGPVQVGMMPPLEAHLEMSLHDMMSDGIEVPAVKSEGTFIDIDKPWHILMANEAWTHKLCSRLNGNVTEDDAEIDATALLNGYVQLGKGSKIGRNVIVEGNLIVGSGTVIENGAILKGDNVIGNHCYIANYCYIERGSTVGDHCVVNHCAELDGLIMNGVYLYHYMEFSGIIGSHTDLGAATVCGTLRFDDGLTAHRVKGRRETPSHYANSVYLGDYCRTGVNAIIMPGCKMGVYSVAGAGLIVEEDIPNRTFVYVKQEVSHKPWGPDKYGW